MMRPIAEGTVMKREHPVTTDVNFGFIDDCADSTFGELRCVKSEFIGESFSDLFERAFSHGVSWCSVDSFS
jgi:hypothetical protein